MLYCNRQSLKKLYMAKYTRSIIKKLIEFDPEISNTQIVQATGFSKQLVSYHRRRMDMGNQLARRTCVSCNKILAKYNSLGLCKNCKYMAFGYEFVCGWCHKVNVRYGHEAAQRRLNKKHKKTALDFCNLSCSGKWVYHTGKALLDRRVPD